MPQDRVIQILSEGGAVQDEIGMPQGAAVDAFGLGGHLECGEQLEVKDIALEAHLDRWRGRLPGGRRPLQLVGDIGSAPAPSGKPHGPERIPQRTICRHMVALDLKALQQRPFEKPSYQIIYLLGRRAPDGYGRDHRRPQRHQHHQQLNGIAPDVIGRRQQCQPHRQHQRAKTQYRDQHHAPSGQGHNHILESLLADRSTTVGRHIFE